jgi:hypothetical protein
MPIWTGNGSTTNWSDASNWDTGVPTNSAPAIFNGSGSNGNKNCLITLSAICSSIDLTGYQGTISFDNPLEIRGSVTLTTSVNFTGSQGLILGAISSNSLLTSNGKWLDRPLTFRTNGTGGFSYSFTDNWRVTNLSTIFLGGNPVDIQGSGVCEVQGDFLINQFTSGNGNFRLTGTGNLASSQIISANINIDSGSNITSIQNLTLGGTATFSHTSGSVLHTGMITTATNGYVTFDLKNVPFNNFTQLYNSRSFLLSDVNFNNVSLGSVSSGTLCAINGADYRIKARGNLTLLQNTGGISGSAIVSCIGSGNIFSNCTLALNFEINTNGVYNFITNATFGANGKSFIYTSGLINFGINTITFVTSTAGSYSIVSQGLNFYNVTFTGANGEFILFNQLDITNNLTINSSLKFLGSFGWTCSGMICITPGAVITFQADVTYSVLNAIQVIGTNVSRIQFVSSSLTNRANFNLNYGATQSLIYVNATRINSNGGQIVWSFAGALNDTINWNIGSRPPSVGYALMA